MSQGWEVLRLNKKTGFTVASLKGEEAFGSRQQATVCGTFHPPRLLASHRSRHWSEAETPADSCPGMTVGLDFLVCIKEADSMVLT